jgi:predicted permease
MRQLRRFLIRLVATVTGRRDEQRVREELEDYLAMMTADNVGRGMTPAEARRNAVLAVGPAESFKESIRDQQGLPVLGQLLQDARIALRRMRQAPGFTAAAILTLALGLGVTSAVGSLAYTLFLRPLPVAGASHLMIVDQIRTDSGRPGYPMSFPDYVYYRDHARSFEGLAAHYSTSPMSVVAPDGTFNVSGAVVSANYFGLLRLQPARGRFFSAEEDRVPGRNPVAVLSHDLWRTRLGADERVLGSTLRINGTAFTVIGIAPEGFRGILRGLPPNEVWIPTAMFSVGYRYCDGLSRGCNVIGVLGRLADGASIDDARTEMSVLAGQLAVALSDTNRWRGVAVRPVRGVRDMEQIQNGPVVALLAGGAILVLLVASANVAGLLLARGLRRRREIAIRLALGASRGRVLRLLLVESVALALAGSTAGFLVALASKQLLLGFFAPALLSGSINVDLSLDPRLILAGIGIALVTGAATGLAPALQATRPDTLPALKDETAGAGARRSLLRDGLIVGQVAISIVILAGSTLLVRSFLTLQRGPGFDPATVAVFRIRPSLIGYEHDRAWAFQREAVRRVEALPGVVAASLATTPTLPKWTRRARVHPDGSPPDGDGLPVWQMIVGARYFEVLGIGVVSGREFDDRDRPGSARTVIVSEALARRLWPDAEALGRPIVVNGDRREVVGVVRDLHYQRVVPQPEPMVYLNFWHQDQTDNWTSDSQLHVRLAGSAMAASAQISHAILAIDPDVPVTEGLTLERRLDFDFADVRMARAMMLTFGALALVLSAIGLHAALSFAIGQRTREIAIRMALGASRTNVGALVFRRGALLVLLGSLIGVAGAVMMSPLLANLLYGVGPRDPLALMAGPGVVSLAALLAIWLPARRAQAMSPVTALRAE